VKDGETTSHPEVHDATPVLVISFSLSIPGIQQKPAVVAFVHVCFPPSGALLTSNGKNSITSTTTRARTIWGSGKEARNAACPICVACHHAPSSGGAILDRLEALHLMEENYRLSAYAKLRAARERTLYHQTRDTGWQPMLTLS
jgi:cytochrome c553